MYGAIELGGTKTVCAVGDPSAGVRYRTVFRTGDPQNTMDVVDGWLSGFELEAVGIGSFGPVCIDPGNPEFGHILRTTKPGWSGFDLVGKVKADLDVPVGIDTDVGSSCIGEYNHGSHADCDPMVYITVGTGIGGAVVSDGKVLHGIMHPEVGHMNLRRLETDDMEGVCPFHPDCAESLASGPALARRADCDPRGLPLDHPVWMVESDYLAQIVLDTVYAYSPEAVILGGGVLQKESLIDSIRRDVLELDNGYLFTDLESVENKIFSESLNGDQALWGCFDIAEDIIRTRTEP